MLKNPNQFLTIKNQEDAPLEGDHQRYVYCRYLKHVVLVTIGDKILGYTDQWSDAVWQFLHYYVNNPCPKVLTVRIFPMWAREFKLLSGQVSFDWTFVWVGGVKVQDTILKSTDLSSLNIALLCQQIYVFEWDFNSSGQSSETSLHILYYLPPPLYLQASECSFPSWQIGSSGSKWPTPFNLNLFSFLQQTILTQVSDKLFLAKLKGHILILLDLSSTFDIQVSDTPPFPLFSYFTTPGFSFCISL